MTEPVKVDAHVHLYRSAEEGIAEKEGYQIWEYGEKPRVTFSALAGTVEDVVQSMKTSGVDKVVVVNLFSALLTRDAEIAALPDSLQGGAREKAIGEIDATLPDKLTAFNRWGCEVASAEPRIVPFIAADALAMAPDAMAGHVREMVESHGARGVKLHCAIQGYPMSDERMWPTYETCQALGIPIISHSGPDRKGRGFAEPRAFGDMLRAFPRLRVVLAHMGGATWRQALEIAQTRGNAYFDCCEILEWTDSSNGPTERELAALIREIGAERVMMGSDFPWYDLDHTIERVMELPLLSREEKEGILGANAVRILGL